MTQFSQPLIRRSEWPSLRAFAKWWWASTPVAPPSEPAKIAPQWLEFVLFRRCQFQVELIALFPGALVPPHRHPHVETYEVHYSGGGEAWLGTPERRLRQPHLVGDTMLRRLRIAAGMPHGGRAEGLTTALSLQRWQGREPTFISDDWEAA
jgi:hypothetical protein